MKRLIAMATVAVCATSVYVIKTLNEVQRTVREVSGKVTQLEEKLTLVQTGQGIKLSPTDKSCLIANVYYEAGVESFDGKIAVAQVTLNRLKSKKWGNSVCSVVKARAQFSWTLKKQKAPKGQLYRDSIVAVTAFESGLRVTGIESSHHYHTDYIKTPKWASESKKIGKLGRHIFYENV